MDCICITGLEQLLRAQGRSVATIELRTWAVRAVMRPLWRRWRKGDDESPRNAALVRRVTGRFVWGCYIMRRAVLVALRAVLVGLVSRWRVTVRGCRHRRSRSR